MKKHLFIFPLILLSFMALSQSIDGKQNAIVCPVEGKIDVIPDFKNKNCYTTSVNKINPQFKHIWIKTQLSIHPELISQSQPLGFYIVGKSSSFVYFNGILIGENGYPSSLKNEEVAGQMDAVFYLDKNLINKSNNNQLILRMSAVNGLLNLSHPINGIFVDIYNNPTHLLLDHYWFSILPFGAFVLAAIYLGVLSSRQKENRSLVLLSMMSFFAACQLLVEITRGVQSYSYTFHDIRLILLVFFSYAFGVSLFAHIVYKFINNKQWLLILITMSISLICVLLVDAYDLKAAIAINIPALFAMLICLYYAYYKVENAVFISIALMIFITLFIVSPSFFLDRYFYYLVASLLVFLFVQQAIDLSNQSKINKLEKARADKLQLIIDQNHQKANPTKLKIKCAGQLTLISMDDIAFCKGAGDYVEIFKTDEKSTLYNGTLKELEISLPAIFLKVHRSYIVNTTKIVSLDRNTAGTGELGLDNGAFIPVSRRIMPKVRESLA